MTKKQEKKFAETKELLSQQLVREENESEEKFAQRKLAFREKQIRAFKEILLQDVSKNGTNKTFAQYTKSLVKQYIQNPYGNRDQLREVSRYLYRVCMLYKRIILYYAMMPTYNYMITQKIDFTKDIDTDQLVKKFQNIVKIFHKFDIQREFPNAISICIRDGIYCAYVYSLDKKSIFLNTLDPQYYKIRGKNEEGQWVVYFDASYFAKGSNTQFVEGINGDTTGCWDPVFIEGWKAYQKDNQNARWFMLPPSKTITLLAGLDDEFDIPVPFFTGSFVSMLDLLDYEQIVADKTALENYILLVSKIPLMDDSSIVDDFAISLEMVQAIQELIDAAVPPLVGTAYSPMDLEIVNFNRSNTTEDTDALSSSVNNLFSQTGAPQLVVSGGSSNTTTAAVKQAIANDASLAFNWLNKLERNFQYYIDKNVDDNYIFRCHRQTIYYTDEYIGRIKDACTLGAATPFEYMTALGNTPYEAWCKLKFEAELGIRDLMIPLESSYHSSSVGAPTKNDDNLSDEGQRTRDGDKNETTRAAN